MSYGKISRRIVDRVIKNHKQGQLFTEYEVRTPNIDPYMLSKRILRRAPKVKTMVSLEDPFKLKIIVYDSY